MVCDRQKGTGRGVLEKDRGNAREGGTRAMVKGENAIKNKKRRARQKKQQECYQNDSRGFESENEFCGLGAVGVCGKGDVRHGQPHRYHVPLGRLNLGRLGHQRLTTKRKII